MYKIFRKLNKSEQKIQIKELGERIKRYELKSEVNCVSISRHVSSSFSTDGSNDYSISSKNPLTGITEHIHLNSEEGFEIRLPLIMNIEKQNNETCHFQILSDNVFTVEDILDDDHDALFRGQEDSIKDTYEKAKTLSKNKMYNKALKIFGHLVLLLRKMFGKYHPLLGLVFYNIGTIQILLKDYTHGLLSFENAIRIRKGFYGNDHLIVSTSHVKIGIIHILQKESSKAMIAFEKALQIRIKSLGQGHVCCAPIYNNIGCIYFQAEKIQKAHESFASALQIYLNVLKEFPNRQNLELEIAMTYINLGKLYAFQNSWKDAGYVFRMAFQLQNKNLTSDHLILLLTLGLISNVSQRKM